MSAAAATASTTLPLTEPRIMCPFTIAVDSREQNPYDFSSIRADADQGSRLVEVPTKRTGLPNGDYLVLGLPQMVVERKSKEDLYSSISQRRENFEQRLSRMQEELRWAAVVVEAEYHELITAPPTFSQFSPKSLSRTLLAWSQRFPRVHWFFLRDRAMGEAVTFRLLERWWRDHKDDERLTSI